MNVIARSVATRQSIIYYKKPIVSAAPRNDIKGEVK